MDIRQFMIDYNIIGIALGTIIGFGLTNWVKEFRKTIIVPIFVNRLDLDEKYGSLASSTVELIVLIALVYLMYEYLVKPSIINVLKKKRESEEKQLAREKSMTKNIQIIRDEVKGIDTSSQMISMTIDDINDRQKKSENVQPVLAELNN